MVSSTGSLEALNSAEIDAEYDSSASPAAAAAHARVPHCLEVASCYDSASSAGGGSGSSGPVSLPIGFGRRRLPSKKYVPPTSSLTSSHVFHSRLVDPEKSKFEFFY